MRATPLGTPGFSAVATPSVPLCETRLRDDRWLSSDRGDVADPRIGQDFLAGRISAIAATAPASSSARRARTIRSRRARFHPLAKDRNRFLRRFGCLEPMAQPVHQQDHGSLRRPVICPAIAAEPLSRIRHRHPCYLQCRLVRSLSQLQQDDRSVLAGEDLQRGWRCASSRPVRRPWSRRSNSRRSWPWSRLAMPGPLSIARMRAIGPLPFFVPTIMAWPPPPWISTLRDDFGGQQAQIRRSALHRSPAAGGQQQPAPRTSPTELASVIGTRTP